MDRLADTPSCYFCNRPVNGELNMHHPDKDNLPDWVEPAHAECHRQYHSTRGHFTEWGKQTKYKGRSGYELCITKWPGFHRMGGLVRARTAMRGADGRFLPTVTELTKSTRAK